MAIKHIIVLFVETPHKFITAKLSIRKPESLSVLRMCSNKCAVLNSHGVSTNKTIITF